MVPRSLLAILAVLPALGFAQDLGVPTTWRVRSHMRLLLARAYRLTNGYVQKFSNTRPLSERISISQDAINAILPQLNAATGEFNGTSMFT